MIREQRAKQFMPFDAMKGLKEALAIREERHNNGGQLSAVNFTYERLKNYFLSSTNIMVLSSSAICFALALSTFTVMLHP